jgi:branched-chain amino acid transport system substrate-binding protein
MKNSIINSFCCLCYIHNKEFKEGKRKEIIMKGRNIRKGLWILAAILLFTWAFILGGMAEAQTAKGPIKIGRVGGMTASIKADTDATTIPIKIFFDEKNWQHSGRKIEMIEEDDEGNPTVGLTKIKKLVEKDKIHILMGPNYTNVAYAARDYLDQQKIPTIVYGGAALLSRGSFSKSIFRALPSGYQIAYPAAKWCVEKGYKNAVFIGNDYSSPRENGRGFVEGLKEAGGKLVAELWPPLNTMDYAPYITQIKALKGQADIVIAALWGAEGLRFVTQWAEFGMKDSMKLFGLSSFANEGLILPQMGDAAIGTMSIFTYSAFVDTPDNKKFVEKFIQKAGMWPCAYSQLGYVTAQLVWEALNAVKGDVENSAKFIEALENVKVTDPQGQTLQFDKNNHSLPMNLYILEVRKVKGEPHNVHIDVIPTVKDPVEKFPK